MSLTRACARLSALRTSRPAFEGSIFTGTTQKAQGPKGAFGYGDVAPPNAPGFKDFQAKPPETISDTYKYIVEGTFKPPLRKEIIEAIGYPGQKKSAGVVTMLGRIYYGPGRYDYGRPKMPQGWFANWFYFAWELGHLMFVTDRWQLFRQFRHIIMTAICYIPFYYNMKWNMQRHANFKELNQS